VKEGQIRSNRLYVRRWQAKEEYSGLPCDVQSLALLDDPLHMEFAHFPDCSEKEVELHANLADAAKAHETLFIADLSATEASRSGRR